MVFDNCSNYCLCRKEDTSIYSFTHWIFSCKNFEYERDDHLDFIDDLCINATLINEQKSLNLSLNSEKDDEDNVKFSVLNFFLGGNLTFDRFDLNDGEYGKLVNHLLLGPTESSPSYMLGLAAFLTGVIPEISCSFRWVFHRTYRCQERRYRNEKTGKDFSVWYRFDNYGQ